MKKTKLLLENFFIYGIGSVIGKLIPLIMLPIITRLLPDLSYFGISDNTASLVSIASYIAIMGMYDAMNRLFFDDDSMEYRKRVCSTTLTYTTACSLIVFLLMFLFRKGLSLLFYKDTSLSYVVLIAGLSTLVGATNTIVAGPARMQNKRLIYIVMNSIGPIISYAIAIVLIIRGEYIISLPLSMLMSSFFIEVAFWIYNRAWFKFEYIDIKLLKPLLLFAIPLIPNFLIYWIFNSCDRLMITQILGVEAAGLYGIGSKLGHASQLIYTAFAAGWQYFAYSTMKDKNQIRDNSKIFEWLCVVSITCTILLCAVSYLIYKIMFPAEYVGGYIIAPYLFLAPLCQMMFQVAISQFAIIKKTWPNMIFLSCGAVVNVLLNLILIPLFGIEGAAIATICGYIITVISCVVTLCKLKLFEINRKLIVSVYIFCVSFIVWRMFAHKSVLIGGLISASYLLFVVVVYYRELKSIIDKIKGKDKTLLD